MDILMTALAQGTIPVIIHEGLFDSARPAFLPLSEVIDWNLAAVIVSSLQAEVRRFWVTRLLKRHTLSAQWFLS